MEDFDLAKRYTYNRSRKVYEIDIPLDFYRDMYDEWDFSPLKKRDLDHDLHDYLMDCADEIDFKGAAFINFYLPKKVKDPEKERVSRVVFKNYIQYCIHKTYLERRRMIRQTFFYILWGLLFLVVAYLIQHVANTTFLLSLLPEGLFIGGWVLFWEAFSLIFFKINSFNRLIKQYKWLQDGAINFIYLPEREIHAS